MHEYPEAAVRKAHDASAPCCNSGKILAMLVNTAQASAMLTCSVTQAELQTAQRADGHMGAQ